MTANLVDSPETTDSFSFNILDMDDTGGGSTPTLPVVWCGGWCVVRACCSL